jgi:hypothetical protein
VFTVYVAVLVAALKLLLYTLPLASGSVKSLWLPSSTEPTQEDRPCTRMLALHASSRALTGTPNTWGLLPGGPATGSTRSMAAGRGLAAGVRGSDGGDGRAGALRGLDAAGWALRAEGQWGAPCVRGQQPALFGRQQLRSHTSRRCRARQRRCLGCCRSLGVACCEYVKQQKVSGWLSATTVTGWLPSLAAGDVWHTIWSEAGQRAGRAG